MNKYLSKPIYHCWLAIWNTKLDASFLNNPPKWKEVRVHTPAPIATQSPYSSSHLVHLCQMHTSFDIWWITYSTSHTFSQLPTHISQCNACTEHVGGSLLEECTASTNTALSHQHSLRHLFGHLITSLHSTGFARRWQLWEESRGPRRTCTIYTAQTALDIIRTSCLVTWRVKRRKLQENKKIANLTVQYSKRNHWRMVPLQEATTSLGIKIHTNLACIPLFNPHPQTLPCSRSFLLLLYI